MNFKKHKIFIIFAIIYILSNLFLILNYDGIYWDDWSLFNHDIKALYNQFLQNSGKAGYLISFLHYFLLNIGNGVFIYRILTVLMLFLCGVFLYKILNTIQLLSEIDKIFITLFFLFSPLYSSKVALIVFTYTFCYFVFYLAFYLLSVYFNKLNIFNRILILILFFISFIMNSLLVFYAVVLIYLFYKNYNFSLNIFKNIINFILSKFDFIILPIVYFILRILYFNPTGLYSDYNIISVKNLMFSPIFSVFQLHYSFILPILFSLKLIFPLFLIFITLLILIYFILNKIILKDYFDSKNKIEIKYDIIFFLLGLLFFSLAVIPYIAVGKYPNMYDWDSRHQVLIPLGFSFILYFGLKLIFNFLNLEKKYQLLILIILLTSFILYQINDGIEYQIDWLNQKSIIMNFKDSEIVNKYDIFFVEEQPTNVLAKKRTFRFYELNGMYKESSGKTDKIFIYEISLEKLEKFKNYEQYNFNEADLNKKNHIKIKILTSKENYFNNNYDLFDKIILVLRFKYLEIFKKQKYEEEIKKLIIIEPIL